MISKTIPRLSKDLNIARSMLSRLANSIGFRNERQEQWTIRPSHPFPYRMSNTYVPQF